MMADDDYGDEDLLGESMVCITAITNDTTYFYAR